MCSPISLPTDSCNLDDAIMDPEEDQENEWSGAQGQMKNVPHQLSFFDDVSSLHEVSSRKRLYVSQASSHRSSMASFASEFQSPVSKRPTPRPTSRPLTVDQKLRTDSLGCLRKGSSPLRTQIPLNQRIVEGGNSPKRAQPTPKKKPSYRPTKSRNSPSDSILPWIPDVSIVDRVDSFAGHFMDDLTHDKYADSSALCQPDMCGELLLQTRELTVVTDSSSQYGSEGDESCNVGDVSKMALRASVADVDRTTFMQVWRSLNCMPNSMTIPLLFGFKATRGKI